MSPRKLFRLITHRRAMSRLQRVRAIQEAREDEELLRVAHERMERVRRGESQTIPAAEFLAQRRAKREGRAGATVGA